MTIASRSLVLATLVLVACSPTRKVLHHEPSGFLGDYSRLRVSESADNVLLYRSTEARWRDYHKVLLEPVTLVRSGHRSLDPVPESDLKRLAVDLDMAVRQRLGDGFTLVTQPGPGVMRIRLAVTSARASDHARHVLSLQGRGGLVTTSGGGPLHPEMRHFLDDAAIEGEIRDAETDVILAQGVEQRRRTNRAPLDTWDQVDRALDAWAARVVGGMERRAGTP